VLGARQDRVLAYRSGLLESEIYKHLGPDVSPFTGSPDRRDYSRLVGQVLARPRVHSFTLLHGHRNVFSLGFAGVVDSLGFVGLNHSPERWQSLKISQRHFIRRVIVSVILLGVTRRKRTPSVRPVF
jgi:hypothetical protein